MKQTVCNEQITLFQVKNKPVIVEPSEVTLSSNAGFLAVAQVDQELSLIDQISELLTDGQKRRQQAANEPSRIEHPLTDLLKQRVYQIALGYEDGLDADTLRWDHCLQLSVGKDRALGSQPMMSRLENWVSFRDVYRGMRALVSVYAREFHSPGDAIVLHVDSTDDPVHGQLGLFNGHYGHHCFHPVVITAEKSGFPFAILQRKGTVHSAHHIRSILKRLVRWLREEMPEADILIKGDCGFGGGKILDELEAMGLDYIVGLSGNTVLYRHVKEVQEEVLKSYEESKEPLQRFMSFESRAGTWSRSRKVIAKVEHTGLGLNTRFVVSTMMSDDPGKMYQSFQVRNGEIEDSIEQLKNGLRFDKTACHKRVPNQVRYFEMMLALILHLKLQQKLSLVFKHVPKVQTIIQKVLKVAALIKKSVRRFFIQLPLCDPNAHFLWHVLQT